MVKRRTGRLAVLLLVVAAVAVPAALSPVAWGQGDEIRVVSQEVESDFPNNVTFKLSATSPDPIEEIRVFLKPVGGERSTYGYLDIEPDTLVSGEYSLRTGTGNTHKPPGTIIRYSFEIRDKAGRVLRTEEEEYLYMDDSLQWKSISDDEGLLTVHYYGDFVEKRARTVLEAAQETMENMGRVLGIRPEERIVIVAYSNYRDMARSLPFRSQAVREDLRTEGMTYAVERVLVVLASDPTVTGVVSHEFTHILVAEAAGRGYSAVPAWMNEGLAEFGNIDQTPHYDRALAYAIFTRRLKPLWYLQDLGGEPNDIIIAYGHGKSVVQYLIGVYGEEKMRELMGAFRTSLSVDEALDQVYGFDQYGLDSRWRLALGLEPLPPPDALEGGLTPSPSPTPVATAGATPAPTPVAAFTPAPPAAEATPEHGAISDEGSRTTRGCGAPAQDAAGLPLDISMLALLAGPMVAANIGWGLGGRRLVRGAQMFHWVSRRLPWLHRGKGR